MQRSLQIREMAETRAALTGEPDALDAAQCRAVIDQALALLDQAWVHLLDERVQHVDAPGQLKRLRRQPPATQSRFYQALLSVFAALGDRHTHCQLTEPFLGGVAFLPFIVRECDEAGKRQFAITESVDDGLRRGDTLVSWNGMAMTEVVQQHMRTQLGANAEARRAKAVQTLTMRPLAIMPSPEGDVALEVMDREGNRRELQLQWRMTKTAQLDASLASLVQAASGGQGAEDGLQARQVHTSSGTFGYIRIASFHQPPAAFLRAFIAALADLPPDGLILDLRECEDGYIPTAEQLLQLFTSEKIEPQGFQFRITELIRHLARTSPALDEWRAPVEAAARRGDAYSDLHPLTARDAANSVGQKYAGPVLLLVDALTYSSAEMLAAGVQDHAIGGVLGTAARTGGGGASAWNQSVIFKLSGDEAFRPLPGAPSFRVAVRRSRRVGCKAGELLEGVGVIPDAVHQVTRNDLFNEEADLMEYAGRMLARQRAARRPLGNV